MRPTKIDTPPVFQKNDYMNLTSTLSILFLLLLTTLLACKKDDPAQPCAEALSGWQITPVAYPDIQMQHAVFFPSERVGYTAGNYGSIMKTTDGGASWTVIHSGAFDTYTTRLNLRAIFFTSEQTGFVAGARKTCCYGDELDKGAVLLKTADGGQSWQKRYFENVSNIHDLRFFNENEGLALFSVDIDSNTTERRLMRTADGGDSWTAVPLPVRSIDSYTFYASPSTLTLLVTGENGESLLATSADKGRNWSLRNGPWSPCNRLYFIDDHTGFATCGSLFFKETVFETKDGGDTWTQAEHPMNVSSLIHFNTNTQGFVINPIYTYEKHGWESNAVLQSFEVFQTTDGGASWQKTELDKACDFTGLTYSPAPEVVFTIGSTANKFIRQ